VENAVERVRPLDWRLQDVVVAVVRDLQDAAPHTFERASLLRQISEIR